MAKSCKQYPVSLSQRQFWLAQQINPASAAYNVASAFLLRGRFDAEAFVACVRDVVLRYDVFRTIYEVKEGVLAALVDDEPRIVVERRHVGASSEAEFVKEARSIANGMASRVFDLAVDSPIRLGIVQEGSENLTVVCLCVHHIAIDLHTKGLIASELAERYAARLSGREYAPLLGAKQYDCFAAWQNAWLESEQSKRQILFWKEYCESRSQAIPIIADYRRPTLPSMVGGAVPFVLNEQLMCRLSEYCVERQTDAYVVLLASYYATLSRYSRCDDFLVGVPLSNRRESEFKDVVGCFVNTVPVSVDKSEGETFDGLVRNARKSMLLGHRNQETPVEVIVKNLSSRGESSRNPLYQIGFTFEAPMRLELQGVTVESLLCETGGAQLELFLRAWRTPEGIRGQLEYDSALFRKETVQRLVDSMLTLLEHGLEEPTCEVDNLRFVPESDLRRLTHWNDRRRDYELVPLSVAFERQVAKTPDAIAFRYQGKSMTYREFDERANQIARVLIERGVKPGDMVPLCTTRCFEMLLGAYGILKAGGAYVPIEPDYPIQRITNILADTGRVLLLTIEEYEEKLKNVADVVIALDKESAGFSAYRSDPPGVSIGLRDPAYVIFTSGSTGKPKGVVNTHGGIANRLCWMQDAFNIDSGDRILFKTPYSFDVSVWEMFWPLQVGASVEIAPREVHRDPSIISELLCSSSITTVHFVPSMLEAFLSHRWGDEPKALRRVICSGEALPKDLQDRFFTRFPGVELHNLYGPTEAAVDVTHWQCRKDSDLPFVPIGHTIANTQIYVLDRFTQQTVIGGPGEICIGGIQVAKGYVGNDELTQQKFVTDPFSTSGYKLYRTGDLGRFLPDGNVQYLGRMDHQVKIRGNRIELGEIEAVLRKHETVREAAVVVQNIAGRTPEVVAYIVGENRGFDELRSHIGRYLPDYMVPAFFVSLEKLPLTKSGKLDTKSLPAVDVSQRVEHRTISVPTTETERRLVGIWGSVLAIKDVSIHDNFFDIGGNSLLLTQVYAQLREGFVSDLRLATLFQYTTIERLARFLDSNAEGSSGVVDAARERATRTKNAFAKAQRRRATES
jgi:amino acid adenylation domain-containing protein